MFLQYNFSFEQALRCWSETIEKEDQVEKQVLQRLTDASKVQFCIFTALSNEKYTCRDNIAWWRPGTLNKICLWSGHSLFSFLQTPTIETFSSELKDYMTLKLSKQGLYCTKTYFSGDFGGHLSGISNRLWKLRAIFVTILQQFFSCVQ